MKKPLLLLVVLILIPFFSYGEKIYEITLTKVNMARGKTLISLGIDFQTLPLPEPEKVDAILRSSLESAVILYPDHEIVGMAFLYDRSLNEQQYSGSLVYKPEQKKILNMEESRGLKTEQIDHGHFLLHIEEGNTLDGIKPERRWLTLKLIYPKKPTETEAMIDMNFLVRKYHDQSLDLNIYVYTGDKSNKSSWEQVRGDDGKYISIRYNHLTREVKRLTELLYLLPR